MVNPKKTNVYAGRHVYMKQRIYASQRKAKWIGIMYLLATVIVTALVCIPHMKMSAPNMPSEISASAFFSDIFYIAENFLGDKLPLAITIIIGTLYDILFFNIFRIVIKLGWLFKKNASKLYGFNRNMYAMDDMSRIYSCTLSTTLIFHFFIVLLAGEVFIDPITIAIFASGLFFHFLLGMLGGNVSIFDTESRIVEIKRECGTFSAFVRNFVQLCVIVLLAYTMLMGNAILPFVEALLTKGLGAFSGNRHELVMALLQFALLIIWVMMTVYATGVKEFDMEGRHAVGRNAFLVFLLLALIVTGGAYLYGRFVAGFAVGDEVLIATITAFFGLDIEIALRRYPRDKNEDDEEVPFSRLMRESNRTELDYFPPTPQYESSLDGYYAPPAPPCYDYSSQDACEEYYQQYYGDPYLVNGQNYNVRRTR